MYSEAQTTYEVFMHGPDTPLKRAWRQVLLLFKPTIRVRTLEEMSAESRGRELWESGNQVGNKSIFFHVQAPKGPSIIQDAGQLVVTLRTEVEYEGGILVLARSQKAAAMLREYSPFGKIPASHRCAPYYVTLPELLKEIEEIKRVSSEQWRVIVNEIPNLKESVNKAIVNIESGNHTEGRKAIQEVLNDFRRMSLHSWVSHSVIRRIKRVKSMLDAQTEEDLLLSELHELMEDLKCEPIGRWL